MKKTITRAGERGSGDYGWLKPNYYFSFGGFSDPDKVHFGALRVINDDFIAGGGAFPTHPHDNMEIITIPFSGALAHKDSTGGEGIIKAGDVQIMTAGTGVQHSEGNASATEPVTLFQIWIFPKTRNVKPAYAQRNFGVAGRSDQWQQVVSAVAEDNALPINQDARISLCNLSGGRSIVYNKAFEANGVFVISINGRVTMAGTELATRDAIGISEADDLLITADESSEVMVIEIPMAI